MFEFKFRILHSGQNHRSGSASAVTPSPKQRSCQTAVHPSQQTRGPIPWLPFLQLKHRSCEPSSPISIGPALDVRLILGVTFAANSAQASRSSATVTQSSVSTPARRIVSLMQCAVDKYGRPTRRFALTQEVRKRRGRRFSGILATWPAQRKRKSSIASPHSPKT